MRLTIGRDSLLRACQVCQLAVNPRTTMPVYQHVKAVPHGDDGIVIMATDLEVGIRYHLRGVAVEQPDDAILPLARLIEILRESDDSEVRLEADGKQVCVTTDAGKYEMPGEDPGSFSTVAGDGPDLYYHEIAAADLLRLSKRTAFAAAKDEDARYAMRGVQWDFDGTTARMVATQGKMLAVADAPCVTQGERPEYEDGRKPNHLVPPKAMRLLDAILSDGDGSQPVRVMLRTSDALFKTERATVYTRLVEGRLPPWKDVIPKNQKVKATLKAGDLLAAVRQASIMTDEEAKRVEFALTPTALNLTAQGPTKGRGAVRCRTADGYLDGNPMTILFDPAYMTPFLRCLDAQTEIRWELVSAERPAVFKVGTDYLFLCVPLI